MYVCIPPARGRRHRRLDSLGTSRDRTCTPFVSLGLCVAVFERVESCGCCVRNARVPCVAACVVATIYLVGVLACGFFLCLCTGGGFTTKTRLVWAARSDAARATRLEDRFPGRQ